MRLVMIAVVLLHVISAAASACTPFVFSFANLSPYVPTLVAVDCTAGDICDTQHLALLVSGMGINLLDPCVQYACVQSSRILAAINRGLAASGECYFQSGATHDFCSYGKDLISIDGSIGTAMQQTFAESGLQASDPRIRGNLALWLPEVYSFLQCTIPVGNTYECLRGVCGPLTASPAHNFPSAAYGCNAIIDDPVLAQYGHVGYPDLGTSTFGRLVFSTDGLISDGTFGYNRPTLNVNTATFPRTTPFGLLAANSYGVLSTEVISNGTNICGSTTGVCPWDDVRGLFLPPGTACAGVGSQLNSFDFVASSCMSATCNAAGVCGTPTNIGAPCFLDQVTLGAEFEDATDGGGAAGRAALDPRCFTDVPRCVQRSFSRQGIPFTVSNIYTGALLWVDMALTTSLETILQNPQDDPLLLTQIEPYLTFSAGTTINVLTVALASTTASTGYALSAPAVCAFTELSAIAATGTDCTRAFSAVAGSPDPIPATPGCAVSLDPSGTMFSYQCVNSFASLPPSVSFDGDGVLRTPPLSGTPNYVRVGVCVAESAAVGTYAVQPANTPFVAPFPGAVAQCIINLCNGQGSSGQYGREPGSFCGDVTAAPLAYSPQCAELRCTVDAACNLTFITSGTLCVNASTPCTTGTVCHDGYCVFGTYLEGCVTCVVDEDCVCTGYGSFAGWCRAGVCTADALTPPQALPLVRGVHTPTSLPPLEPWDEEEFLGFASGQLNGDSNLGHGLGYSYTFDPSAQGSPRVCRVPVREQALFAAAIGAPCYSSSPAFGLCRLNGVCGPPAPLLRFAYNTTNATLLPTLLSQHVPCNNGVPSTGTFPCIMQWTYQGVFTSGNTAYNNPNICSGTLVCSSMLSNLSIPVYGTPPAISARTSLPGVAGDGCTPTPLELLTATQEIGDCSGSGTLTIAGWVCDGISSCLPPPATDQTGCDQSRLFYPTLPANSANNVAISLQLPTSATYGPCIIPAQCDPAAGICAISFAPTGAQCPGLCGGWPAGVCNSVGACLRTGNNCFSNNSCLTAYCPPYARLDSGLWGLLDYPPGQAGVCVGIPVEYFPGGQVGSGSSSSVTCTADANACTVGETCDGTGNCVIGDHLVCADAQNTCLITMGCSPTFGRCLATQRPTGTPCATQEFCMINGTCSSNATCQSIALFCPALSEVVCAGVTGTCYGITAVTLVPESPHGAYQTVTISIGGSSGLAVVTIVDTIDDIIPALQLLGQAGAVGLLASAVTGGNLVGSFDPNLPAFSPPSSYAGVCVYSYVGLNSPCDLQPPDSYCGTGGMCVNGACVATGVLNCTTGNTTFCEASTGTCITAMGGCVYPPSDIGTTCGFAGVTGCMSNFTCEDSGSPDYRICAGADIGCQIPLAACQVFVPSASCTNGCNVTTATDGANCSCVPQGRSCSGSCSGGICVLKGSLAPTPSLASMQDFITSVSGTNPMTGTGTTLSKSAVMIILTLVYVIVGLVALCFACLCTYDIVLLGRYVDEPMLLRQCCWFVCIGLVLFLALMLFAYLYLNT